MFQGIVSYAWTLYLGASSGIGQGAAIEFAKHGSNLVLGGRNVDQLKDTKSQCVKAGLKENQVRIGQNSKANLY